VIDILLATYNGEKYVAELIDSLVAQKYQSWRLVVSDDGSRDGTVDIIQEYQRRFPERVVLRARTGGARGARGNFAFLLGLAQGEYVMLCDQDDIWTPTKIEKTLSTMQAAERRMTRETPLLVFSDLRVVDANRRLIDGSFYHYQQVDPTDVSVGCLLTRNVIVGCAVMINRPLLQLAVPMPREAIIHDWWLALLACLSGHIEHIPESLLEYRQHGQNDWGARRISLWALLRRNPQRLLKRQLRLRNRTILQARALLRRLGEPGSGFESGGVDLEALAAVRDYAAAHPWLKRRWILWKHGMLTGNIYARASRALLF